MSKNKTLTPERRKQPDLFICEVSDTVIKDDMASMEHPIFALSKNPDHKVRRYEHNDIILEVEPGARGIATIYDKDVLIFAVSKLMEAKRNNQPYSRHVKFTAYDFLVFSNRMTNGRGYEGLKAALARLDGTRLRTNIKTGDTEEWEAFGLIDGAKIKKETKDGRVLEWGITLSEWLFRAIESNQVLTLHKDYFRLSRPLARRIYEIARKHCGHKDKWVISIENLKKKSGSTSSIKRFRQTLSEVTQIESFPDYTMEIKDKNIIFHNRKTMRLPEYEPWSGKLDSDVYHDGKQLAPGWDIYVLEDKWRHWIGENEIEPKFPERHFLKFCTSWFAKNGSPS